MRWTALAPKNDDQAHAALGANLVVSRILLFLLWIYRHALSPLLHVLGGPWSGCRFTPTCSEYARQAVVQHGPWHGARLAAGRLCRCHPWGGCGEDPVPTRPVTPATNAAR